MPPLEPRHSLSVAQRPGSGLFMAVLAGRNVKAVVVIFSLQHLHDVVFRQKPVEGQPVRAFFSAVPHEVREGESPDDVLPPLRCFALRGRVESCPERFFPRGRDLFHLEEPKGAQGVVPERQDFAEGHGRRRRLIVFWLILMPMYRLRYLSMPMPRYRIIDRGI